MSILRGLALVLCLLFLCLGPVFSKSSDSDQGYTVIPPKVNYFAWAEAEASADESGYYSVWAQVGESEATGGQLETDI